jgi:citrate synthase
MNPVQAWREARRNRILTRKGGWRIGGGVSVHGHSLFDELVGRHSFIETLCLEVLGALPEPRLARWIEASFLCLSFPDPRIWCNQIGALAGSARVDPVAGIAAGVMASDSALYGPGATRAACEFLLDARAALAAGATPEEFLATRTRRGARVRAPGFTRPIARGDDRVGALARLATELGFEDGEHLRLAWRIDALLAARGAGDGINMLGYVAAFLLDRGLAIDAGERLYALCVNAGVHACYAEAADEPAGGFLPLAVDDVEYTGVAARELVTETCA